jgi:putative oxidoreductase
MNASTSLSGSSDAASPGGGLVRIAPYVLSLLRIMTALLFLQHGLSKFFGFPSATGPHPTALFDLELFHAPQNFYPALNRGELAIMFCFVFLYLIFAGAGPLSLDALIWGNARKS